MQLRPEESLNVRNDVKTEQEKIAEGWIPTCAGTTDWFIAVESKRLRGWNGCVVTPATWRVWPYSWLSSAERAGIAMLHRRIRHARPNRETPNAAPAQRIMTRPNPRTVRHPSAHA